jgi:hypothetical protein
VVHDTHGVGIHNVNLAFFNYDCDEARKLFAVNMDHPDWFSTKLAFDRADDASSIVSVP